MALMRGELDRAESYFRDLMEGSEESGDLHEYHMAAVEAARTHLFVRNDTALAQETLASALARHPLESIELLDRPYVSYAVALAMTGQPARAKAFLRELRDSIPQDMWGRFRLDASWANAWIAMAEGRFEEARVEFQRQDEDQSSVYRRTFGLAVVHDRMAEPDSAIALYEQFLKTPYYARYSWDPYWLPVVYERLAQLWEELGDPENAAKYYTKFVELWTDADPELQPRVQEARRAIERLGADVSGSLGSG
jgi:tetratricopeptide (TPR) repeat protein